MKSRNFGNLSGNSAASLNSGTIGIQKDKIVHLDPLTEILYDPEENIRNGKVVDDSLEGLVELRQTIDEEQLQPIRVYPLPPNKLDPAKPAMKYGIGFGHRRTLACRLTNEDSPLIPGKARKVAAVIDVDWLKKGKSYRLRCQIRENTQRLDLNPVELGQALRDYQRELSEEEKRHVSQAELMEAYRLKEKTVYNLLKAAEFHDVAKEVCHRRLLKDLDVLVTFDQICKANEPLGRAMYESMKVDDAPRHRSLIRLAKTMAEDPSYVFDPKTWAWPASVEQSGVKPMPVAQMPAPANAGQLPSSELPPAGAQQPIGGANGGNDTGAGQGHNSQELGSGGANVNTEPNKASAGPAPAGPAAQEPGQGGQTYHGGQQSSNEAGGGQSSAPANPAPQPAANPQPALNGHGSDLSKGPIIMVEFKMGAEAASSFTGELLIGHKAKGSSNGMVAYLNDGREELIEVPLKFINLVSINHQ